MDEVEYKLSWVIEMVVEKENRLFVLVEIVTLISYILMQTIKGQTSHIY